MEPPTTRGEARGTADRVVWPWNGTGHFSPFVQADQTSALLCVGTPAIKGHRMAENTAQRPVAHPQPLIARLPFHSIGGAEWLSMSSGINATLPRRVDFHGSYLPPGKFDLNPLALPTGLERPRHLMSSPVLGTFPYHLDWLTKHDIPLGRPPCECSNQGNSISCYESPDSLEHDSAAALSATRDALGVDAGLSPSSPAAAGPASPGIGQEVVDRAELKDLEQFAACFKSRRIKLGYTQTNVGERKSLCYSNRREQVKTGMVNNKPAKASFESGEKCK